MTTATASAATERLTAAGIELEVIRRGAGRTLLLLHGFDNIAPASPFIGMLADAGRILAPSHPGFGDSARPDDFETVYDLVHLYLHLIETLKEDKLALMGFSFGGWLAAEIAAKAGGRIDKLILVDPLGIKVSGRETPDIFDVFNKHPDDVRRRSWHNPQKWAPDYDAMEDDQLITIHRNRDALCRYGWHPYMHNPQLKRWLQNIRARTLVLWGAADQIVTPAYGEAYARLIPGARFEVIPEAGHHPQLEQAEAFVKRCSAFLQE